MKCSYTMRCISHQLRLSKHHVSSIAKFACLQGKGSSKEFLHVKFARLFMPSIQTAAKGGTHTASPTPSSHQLCAGTAPRPA